MGFFHDLIQGIDNFFGVGAKNPPATANALTEGTQAPKPRAAVTSTTPRAAVAGQNLYMSAGAQGAPIDPRSFAPSQQQTMVQASRVADADSLNIDASFELQKQVVALQPFAGITGGDVHIRSMTPSLGARSPETTLARAPLVSPSVGYDMHDYVAGNIPSDNFQIPRASAAKSMAMGATPPGDTLAVLSGVNRYPAAAPSLTDVSGVPVSQSLLTASPSGDDTTPAPPLLPNSLQA